MSLYTDNYQDSWLFEYLEDADEFYDVLTRQDICFKFGKKIKKI